MSGPIEIVLVLAAIGYVLFRRVMGEPAQAKRMLILPAVLTVIGLTKVSGQIGSSTALLFLVATTAISIVLGVLRGTSVRISQRDGLAFVRYTGLTIGLWVANLAIKFGANFLLGAIDKQDVGALSNSLLLSLGLGILAEGLVVLYRALRGGHTVMWAKGKNGAPHQMSPTLDNLRGGLTNRAAAGWNTQQEQPRDYRR